MKRPSRDKVKELFWRKALVRWTESGVSQAEFCEREKLNANTFSSWKKILRERDDAKLGSASQSASAFVPVSVAVEESTRCEQSEPVPIAEINLDSRVVRIFNGASIDTLRFLLKALRE